MILLKSKKEFNIGIVTIGKSPRLDIESELKKTIDYEVNFTHSGALDKILPNQLYDLAPLSDSDTLVTLYDDETEIQVSHKKITKILYNNISEIVSKVDVIVMACTGYEEMGNYQIPILFPGKITENLIMDYSNKKDFKLGVVQPHSNQIEKEYEKWNFKNIDADVYASSPYGNPNVSADQSWIDVTNSFEQFKPDLVYLNCMGMRSTHKDYIHENLNVPVLLAANVTGMVINQILK